MKIYDITISLSNETPVWEGDKRVNISQDSMISSGADYNISRLEMSVHAGTHIDAPFHLMADGSTIDQIPLERLIGKVRVIQIAEETEQINASVLNQYVIEPGIKRVLFKTRNSNYWNDEPCRFRDDYIALDSSGAEWLSSKGIVLAGIDWFSISAMDDLMQPHLILLKAGIVIVENLDLRCVEAGIYDLICLPMKLCGTDGAPARVILIGKD
jgi:arylformamidase